MARWFVDRLPQRGIPSVSLRRLLPGRRFVGCVDWEVSGCCDDHRRLDPGQLFVAVPRCSTRAMTVIASCARRSSGAPRAWWWSSPAPRPGGSRSSSPTHGPRTRGSARRCPATRRITWSRWESPAASARRSPRLMVRSILEAAGQRFGLSARRASATEPRPARSGPGFEPSRGELGAGAASLARSLLAGRGLHRARRVRPRGRRPGGPARRNGGSRLQGRRHRDLGGGAARIAASKGSPSTRPWPPMSSATGILRKMTWLEDRRAKAEAVPPGRPGGIGGRERRRPECRDPGRSQPRRAPGRLRDRAGHEPGRGVDVSARLEWVDGSGTRMFFHGFDREVAVHLPLVGTRAATLRIGRGRAGLGPRDRPRRGRRRAGGDRLVAGHLESGRRGPGLRRPGRRSPDARGAWEALAALRAIASGRVHCVLSQMAAATAPSAAGWPPSPKPAPTA